MNGEIMVEITERIAPIGETSESGWTMELNKVSWNEAPAKFDIRMWDGMHERMSRGITLKEEEAKNLYEALAKKFGEELANELADCRNELCLQCGKYKEAHLGNCDGCRWCH